jgi:sucrose-6-phosphate hydrolase SacC (GH32 family)
MGDTVRVRVRLLLDRSSLEVFGQDGESVLTELIFPAPGRRRLDLRSEGEGPRVAGVTIHPLGR